LISLCVSYGEKRTQFQIENVKERDKIIDPGEDRRAILTWILNEDGVKARNEVAYLRVGSMKGFVNTNEPSAFIKGG
jgi:hypothetical protein